MADPAQHDGTGITTFPPLVFALTVGAAFGADRLVPFKVVPDDIQLWLGLVVIGIFICLAVWAAVQFYVHRTTIHVSHAASHLMTSGPYRVSRNPVYLAMLGTSLGIGIAADLIWMVPFLALAVLYMQRHVIDLEEAFLEAKFGDEYRAFKAQVRRWI